VATYSLIGAFVVVFVVEKVLLRTSDGLIDMGALSNQIPDWWRFVAYAFLHEPSGSTFGIPGLPLHLIFNSFATYIVGRLVEQLYGWRVLIATFLVTAVGAGIASVAVATVSNNVSATIGASGGIMGLLGLLFMLGRVQGRDVPVGIAHAMRQYALTYGAMVVVFGFLVTNVDNVAHVGGFITGALVGLVLPPLRRVGGRELNVWQMIAVYAVFAASALALVFAVINLVSVLGVSPGLNTSPG
jgi:rhomboid protease GluP